jgi:hypothetical protein
MRPNNEAGGLGKPPLYSFPFIQIFRHNELTIVTASFVVSLLKQRVPSLRFPYGIYVNRREGRISIKHGGSGSFLSRSLEILLEKEPCVSEELISSMFRVEN